LRNLAAEVAQLPTSDFMQRNKAPLFDRVIGRLHE
jgi:hypothetical protein